MKTAKILLMTGLGEALLVALICWSIYNIFDYGYTLQKQLMPSCWVDQAELLRMLKDITLILWWLERVGAKLYATASITVQAKKIMAFFMAYCLKVHPGKDVFGSDCGETSLSVLAFPARTVPIWTISS